MAGPSEARPPSLGGRPDARAERVPVRVALVAAFMAVLVAGVGGLATDLGPWYRGLTQPPWKPPDLVFGPVWTLLYALTAWACARASPAANTSPGQAARSSAAEAAFVGAHLRCCPLPVPYTHLTLPTNREV